MDAEKLRILELVIKEGKLSLAAEKTSYSVSGISRMMDSLEEEMGMKLLERKRNGVVPTRNYQEIKSEIRNMVRLDDNLREKLSAMRGGSAGRLVIGTSYSSYYTDLTEIIRRYNGKYPEVRIDLVEKNSSELVRALEEHQVDFAITSRREAGFEFIPLGKNEMCAVISSSHPAAEKELFDMEDLEKYDFIMMYPDEETDNSIILDRYGIKPNVRFSTTDNYSALSMVRQGLGICLNTDLNLADVVKSREIAIKPLNPRVYIDVGLTLPKSEYMSNNALRFVEMLKDYFSICA